jgi:hypothetical protein
MVDEMHEMHDPRRQGHPMSTHTVVIGQQNVADPRSRSGRTMRAAIFEASGVIKVADRSHPVVDEPTDAVVRVVLTCVSGGDLFYYRGVSPVEPGPIGHEFVGVVEDVGADVRGIARGDLVIAPSEYSDGTRSGSSVMVTTSTSAPSTGPARPGSGGRRFAAKAASRPVASRRTSRSR